MKSFSFPFFCLIVFLVFHSVEAFSTHVLGADISYTHLGQYKYQVTYRVYRSCADLPFNGADFKVSCENGSSAVTINPQRTSIRDISEVCSKDSLPCMPANTTSNPGIEEHIYQATIDFNQTPYQALKIACCKVLFSMSVCCRNGAVTTISPGNFYLESMLNLCAVGSQGNTSAVFLSPPIQYLCCNQPVYYNINGNEIAEGDSISYESVNPLNAVQTNENYTGNFTPVYPLTPYCPPNPGVLNCKPLPSAFPPRGFYFNQENGDIIFTPTNCTEGAVLNFKITEWRKDNQGQWQEIGYVKRESTWFVKNCSENNAPYFTGNNKYSICEGSKLCFTINTKDDPFLPKQTKLDTVHLSWDSSISAARFTILDLNAREKSAEFCWQTEIGDARPNSYTFSVTANDDFCPSPGKSSRGYTITVKPKAFAQVRYHKGFKGKLVFEAIPDSISSYDNKNYTYQFTIRDSSNTGSPLYFGYNKKDSFTFSQAGTYRIERQINNPPYNCPTVYQDTVVITGFDLLQVNPVYAASIQLFPNPATDLLLISSSELVLQGAFLHLFSIDGQVVLSAALNDSPIDISGLSAGVYTVQIQVGETRFYKKLLIE